MSEYRKEIENSSGNQNVLTYTMVSATVLGFNGKRFLVEDGVELLSISHVIY